MLYELDGNNNGPLELGQIGDRPEAFLHAAVAHVKKAYIQPFPDSHFSMMALGPGMQARAEEGARRRNW